MLSRVHCMSPPTTRSNTNPTSPASKGDPADNHVNLLLLLLVAFKATNTQASLAGCPLPDFRETHSGLRGDASRSCVRSDASLRSHANARPSLRYFAAKVFATARSSLLSLNKTTQVSSPHNVSICFLCRRYHCKLILRNKTKRKLGYCLW